MREHRPSLLECSAGELASLARALQALTRGFDRLFARPFPYVMVVHQAPTRRQRAAGHLHVEFYPPLRTAEKLKYLAGCEQGAGHLHHGRPARGVGGGAARGDRGVTAAFPSHTAAFAPGAST